MFGKRLNRTELGELRALNTLIVEEEFKLNQVKGNTAFVPGAKSWLKTQEGVIQVLKNAREEFIHDCCVRHSVEGKVRVDLSNGKIYGPESSTKDK